ncbi:SH3 domain-binding glutamic acid-rich-like protein 3 [Centroberyx gerrardi]|uniref:SH3 domain-binding glutamic acid-rich-like protein 3 n=1 Tax=Centroberyx gerrardi TaxID=166262 RepID=UPI003AB09DC2
MSLIVFYSSVGGSLEMKKHQQKIFLILDSKKIPYKAVDIAQSGEDKEEMRRKAGNPKALPPQICNGDTYCGDYDAFENAVEMEKLETFLKL